MTESDTSRTEPTTSSPLLEPPPPGFQAQGGGRSSWELVAQFQSLRSQAVWGVRAASVVLAVVVLSQVILYYDLFARQIHWSAGVAWLVLVGVGGWFLVGRPVARYLRMPQVLSPPDVDLNQPDLPPCDLALRARFVSRFADQMRVNPELRGQSEDFAALSRRAASVADRARNSSPGQIEGMKRELQDIERSLDRGLSELDRKVDAYIRAEALAVATGTAISQNGTLDAFIVMWRSVNMVSRISRYYHGRPNLMGSLRILSDVSMAVVTGRVADDVADVASGLLVGALGGIGSAVTGSLVDGTVNGLMTLRVGLLAKGRCRGFEAWSEARARSLLAGSSGWVKEQSRWLVTEMAGRLGVLGTAAGQLATAVVDKGKAAASAVGNAAADLGKATWTRVFGRSTPTDLTGPGHGNPTTSTPVV